MKKIISLSLLLLTTISLSACGNNDASNKSDKGSQKVENKVKKTGKWSFDGTTYTTAKGKYKITAVKKMPSSEDGKNVIAFEFDYTNTSKKEHDLLTDDSFYEFVHATQKTDTSNKNLNPGSIGLDDNANSLEQAREDVMNSDSVLPGKTVQGVAAFSLVNDNPVKLKFDDASYTTIATKEYTF